MDRPSTLAVTSGAIGAILGMKVRQARIARGLTLAEVAQRCDLSPSYLTEIERGLKYPKPDKLVRLATVLGTTYDSLVSTQLAPGQADLGAFLSSAVLEEFPFELFGLTSSDLVKLFTREPTRASALIHALVDIARQYDVRTEHFLRAALRSFQEMHDNYFVDIEQAAEAFSAEHGLTGDPPLRLRGLRELVENRCEVDMIDLDRYPALGGYRSIHLPGAKPRLLLNPKLDPPQVKFVLARELGYDFLQLEERAPTSAPDTHDSFQQILNDFKASYFGGALLMPRSLCVEDLKRFLSHPRWNAQTLLALLARYDVTPEMLFYRFCELIPQYFGARIHFLRLHGFGESYRLTKQLNLSRLRIPSGLALEEHHCRRWLATELLRLVEIARSEGGPFPICGAQRSIFLESGDSYLCIGLGRPLTLSPEVNSSVAVGFQYDDQLVEQVRFSTDPDLKEVVVNDTCERCPLSEQECEDRAAPPRIYQRLESDRRRQQQLSKLSDDLRR